MRAGPRRPPGRSAMTANATASDRCEYAAMALARDAPPRDGANMCETDMIERFPRRIRRHSVVMPRMRGARAISRGCMLAVVVLCAIATALPHARAVSYPDSYHYSCEDRTCKYTSSGTTYENAADCMKSCGQVAATSTLVDSISNLTITTPTNGSCNNCALVALTRFDFPRLLQSFGLSTASISSGACAFIAKMNVMLPDKWSFAGATSTCTVADHVVTCSHPTNNVARLDLDAAALGALMKAPSEAAYRIQVGNVSTRATSGNFTSTTTLEFDFAADPCEINRNKINQALSVQLSSPYYELKGRFTEMNMTADNPVILNSTTVHISFRSGGLLTGGVTLTMRVPSANEQLFEQLIESVDAARLKDHTGEHALEVVKKEANLSFVIPNKFTDTIENGERVVLSFDHFKTPGDESNPLEKAYLAAFQIVDTKRVVIADYSPVDFFSLGHGKRAMRASVLDIISAAFFGICFLVSLVIIRWRGLPLTMSTLWTDMVAISTLFAFATGCGGYVVWVLQPSKAYIYWYSAQYFFNAMMVFSLCFHWAAVLAFKAFKRLTFRSPVVLVFVGTNLAVLALIVVCCITSNDKLICVFDREAVTCESESACEKPLAAGGVFVRTAVHKCKMESFYLAFGAAFIGYTLMLMLLGCLVMRRGRSLMLHEDPSEPRMRKSLAIFYIIISTTIVLYVSAQVIYVTQYVSSSNTAAQLSDLVWYVFILWLPQGLPPMLLLFLQWNPSTEQQHPSIQEDDDSMAQSSKDDIFSMTPRSSASSPNLHYSKLFRSSLTDSILNLDEPGNRLRLIVRLKLPATFDRGCFMSLDFATVKDAISHESSVERICRSAVWKCVGSTEPMGMQTDAERRSVRRMSHRIYPFVAVLEVPLIGPASHILLRFILHTCSQSGVGGGGPSFLDNRVSSSHDSSDSESDQGRAPSKMSHQMTMFRPMLEFVTTSQAVLDAAASGQPLTVHPQEETTCTVLDNSPCIQRELDSLLLGNLRNAELSVQTVMMPGEDHKDDQTHTTMGNITRFFHYDSDNGSNGLVVEELQESVYSNSIPRQLIELIAVERQEQVERARAELQAFMTQKKDKQNRGFYGNLIGQIQDEGDSAMTKEWLEARLHKRKKYVAALRKNFQFLVNRDKHKQYFKASVEKNVEDLRFVPINMHIQDLLIGPTHVFMNEEKRRASKEVMTYDFTTVGAPAAHYLKFNKGGILSLQAKVKKAESKLPPIELDALKWSEEQRAYDDLKWELQARMDCCLAQAMAALTTSFVRKIEIAIQNPDVDKGEEMLQRFASLGFLFEVESLLSTHGKEIGMLEDMAGSVSALSQVAFVIQDIKDKPSNRFSFRMSRFRKEVVEDAAVVKVTVSQKHARDVKRTGIKYIIKIQVSLNDVMLPEQLANGGEIKVTPVLFTQGINEMQTIANNTERAKTELQDTINMNSLRPLKQFCDEYCRQATALRHAASSSHHSMDDYIRSVQRGHRTPTGASALPRLSERQVREMYMQLERMVLDAAQSLVKTKRPEILQRSSDLCRELGGGRVTVCKSAKDRTAMSVTLEQVRILQLHHNLAPKRLQDTLSVMRTHGVRIENALKNTGKRMFAFNKLQRSLLPEEYRCPDQVGGTGNVS